MSHQLKIFLATLYFGLASLAAPVHAEEAAMGKSFHDDFDRLDTKRWYVSNGWSNGDWQNCTWLKKNVSVSDGQLTLAFDKQKTENREFGCAEVQTNERFSYGTYEVRMKATSGAGLVSAMFTYIGPTQKQPWDEIDFEVLGKDTSQIQVNQYVDGKGENVKLVPVPGDAAVDFHDYAFVWEKDRLQYFIDGKLAHTVTDAKKIPTHPQKIMLSIWGSNTLAAWLGDFVHKTRVTSKIDRITYTAPGAPCQFPESVACHQQ